MNNTVDKVNQISDASAGQVLESMHGLMHEFRAHQLQMLRDCGAGLTPMEARILGFFARRPGGTQSDLAQHSGRDKAQLARLIKGLKERGLLDAEPDQVDRRNVGLRLSDAGATLHGTLRGLMRQVETRALTGFSADELGRMADLLQRMKDNLAHGRDDATSRCPASDREGDA